VAALTTASAALARISAALSGSGPARAAIVCAIISADGRGSCASIIASAAGSRSRTGARSRASAVMSMIAASKSSGELSPASRPSSSRR
jgi:hypothetical protein